MNYALAIRQNHKRISDKQIDLFDWLESLGVDPTITVNHFNELSNLISLRLSEARYAADYKAERELLQIREEKYQLYSERESFHLQSFLEVVQRLLVETWMVLVKGKPSSFINDQPAKSHAIEPTYSDLDSILSLLPDTLKKRLPDTFVIGYYIYTEDIRPYYGDLSRRGVTYHHDGRWFSIGVEANGKVYGLNQLYQHYRTPVRVRPEMIWTPEGYQLMQSQGLIDPCIPATSTAYMSFYGRDEAVKRLRLQGVM